METQILICVYTYIYTHAHTKPRHLHLATVKFYMCPYVFQMDYARLMYVEMVLGSLQWLWASADNFQGK